MYESGWAAVAQHTSGVVLVYNPEKAGNDNEVRVSVFKARKFMGGHLSQTQKERERGN